MRQDLPRNLLAILQFEKLYDQGLPYAVGKSTHNRKCEQVGPRLDLQELHKTLYVRVVVRERGAADRQAILIAQLLECDSSCGFRIRDRMRLVCSYHVPLNGWQSTITSDRVLAILRICSSGFKTRSRSRVCSMLSRQMIICRKDHVELAQLIWCVRCGCASFRIFIFVLLAGLPNLRRRYLDLR